MSGLNDITAGIMGAYLEWLLAQRPALIAEFGLN
jgi:hypothetical protein